MGLLTDSRTLGVSSSRLDLLGMAGSIDDTRYVAVQSVNGREVKAWGLEEQQLDPQV